MYFLIDYENVNGVGMEGTEYLREDDEVLVFYSDKCGKMVSYRIEDIEKQLDNDHVYTRDIELLKNSWK